MRAGDFGHGNLSATFGADSGGRAPRALVCDLQLVERSLDNVENLDDEVQISIRAGKPYQVTTPRISVETVKNWFCNIIGGIENLGTSKRISRMRVIDTVAVAQG